jgi:hypothetical protein
VRRVFGGLGQATSGAALVPEGLDAFTIRVATARAAGRSLDLQYYMWHGDVTGKLLAGEVLVACCWTTPMRWGGSVCSPHSIRTPPFR